jgi:hypothetical protein
MKTATAAKDGVKGSISRSVSSELAIAIAHVRKNHGDKRQRREDRRQRHADAERKQTEPEDKTEAKQRLRQSCATKRPGKSSSGDLLDGVRLDLNRRGERVGLRLAQASKLGRRPADQHDGTRESGGVSLLFDHVDGGERALGAPLGRDRRQSQETVGSEWNSEIARRQQWRVRLQEINRRVIGHAVRFQRQAGQQTIAHPDQQRDVPHHPVARRRQ